MNAISRRHCRGADNRHDFATRAVTVPIGGIQTPRGHRESRSQIVRRAARAVTARILVLVALIALLANVAATAHAADLMQVYRQALKTNPVLRQAEAQNRIGQAGVAQSRAPLLPQLHGSVALTDSHGTATGPQWVDTPSGPVLESAR